MGRKNSSLRGRIVLTLFMLLLLCLGSGVLLDASREFMESLEALSWPTVVGNVTRSELKIETHKIKTRSSDQIRRTATEETIIPLIDYTFEVDGKEFQGNRMVLSLLGSLRVPSEIVKLKWEHINWEAKRIFVVDSSKTEHHSKRQLRVIPLLPQIEKELLKLHLEADDGGE